MKDICVVFCCNSNYLHKFKSTYHQLINNGKYNGDVCLYTLLQKYLISITNDQGIIALYFTQIKPCWKQLKRKCNELYYYDYVRCVNSKYIMVKNTSNNWLNIGYNE